jgi:hypothetical protein
LASALTASAAFFHLRGLSAGPYRFVPKRGSPFEHTRDFGLSPGRGGFLKDDIRIVLAGMFPARRPMRTRRWPPLARSRG